MRQKSVESAFLMVRENINTETERLIYVVIHTKDSMYPLLMYVPY